jgi:hypothetical protein
MNLPRRDYFQFSQLLGVQEVLVDGQRGLDDNDLEELTLYALFRRARQPKSRKESTPIPTKAAGRSCWRSVSLIVSICVTNSVTNVINCVNLHILSRPKGSQLHETFRTL